METKRDIRKEISEQGYSIIEIASPGYADLLPVDIGHSTLTLCHRGKLVVDIGDETLRMTSGSRVVSPKTTLYRIRKMTPDFMATMLLVSDEIALDAASGLSMDVLEKLSLRHNVKIASRPDEWEMLINLIDTLKLYRPSGDNVLRAHFVSSVMRAILLAIVEMESAEMKGATMNNFTLADERYRLFVRLVSENVDRQHDVAFYADKLNITPKYLSEITKMKSGVKAKEIISRILISKIKRDILLSGKSIKVLAFEYRFADQSSFGKFFRKMTGLSPGAFKAGQLAEPDK